MILLLPEILYNLVVLLSYELDIKYSPGPYDSKYNPVGPSTPVITKYLNPDVVDILYVVVLPV